MTMLIKVIIKGVIVIIVIGMLIPVVDRMGKEMIECGTRSESVEAGAYIPEVMSFHIAGTDPPRYVYELRFFAPDFDTLLVMMRDLGVVVEVQR